MKLFKRIKHNAQVYVLALIFIIGADYYSKPSINKVTAYTIDNEIRGIGRIKSYKIINEREVNGDYKNIQDFLERTSGFVGKTVQTRIVRAYKI